MKSTQSYGVVGYHVCFTRKRSWVRTPVALLFSISLSSFHSSFLSYQLVSLISLLSTPLIHFPSAMIFEHISHNNDAIVIFLCVIRAKNKNPVPSLQNQKYCINLITLKKQLNLFYVGMQLLERLLSPCDINKESSKKFISLLWQELISRKR